MEEKRTVIPLIPQGFHRVKDTETSRVPGRSLYRSLPGVVKGDL